MGDGSGRIHNNNKNNEVLFDCVPHTKPIEVITIEIGTAPQRVEQKGCINNTVFKLVEVKVRTKCYSLTKSNLNCVTCVVTSYLSMCCLKRNCSFSKNRPLADSFI